MPPNISPKKTIASVFALVLALYGTVFYFAPKIYGADATSTVNALEIKQHFKKTEEQNKLLTADGNLSTQIQQPQFTPTDPATNMQTTDPATPLPASDSGQTAVPLTDTSSAPTSFLQIPDQTAPSQTEEASPPATTTTPTQKTVKPATTKKTAATAEPVALNVSLPIPLANMADTLLANSVAGFWKAVSIPYNYADTGALSPLKTKISYALALLLAVLGILLLTNEPAAPHKKPDKLSASLRQAILFR